MRGRARILARLDAAALGNFGDCAPVGAGVSEMLEPAEFLDNEVVSAEYLSVAIEDPNPDVFLRAMANVAKARGIAEVAKASGLGRESLYKALAPGAKVRYETVRKVLDSLGVKLKVAA
jgi:probable addiction module antidote protein